MRFAPCLLAALLSFAIPSFAVTCFAQDEPAPKFVIARASGDATVLYDATPEVAAIVRDKLDDGAADRRLQHDALRVLANVTSQLPDAQTITIRVTYQRTGDVSPVYGTPTFAGIERYANLKASAADAKSDRDKWKEAKSAALPAWVTFAIVGKLPPR